MAHDHGDRRSVEHESGHRPTTSFWKSKAALVAAGFLIIGLFFLWSEHRAHLLGVLPYLLILACPLMHVFMHGGHGGHHGSHGRHDGVDQAREPRSGVES
jgi:hypothetical protein